MTDTRSGNRGTRLYGALARFITALLIAKDSGDVDGPVIVDDGAGPFEVYTRREARPDDNPDATAALRELSDAEDALGDTLTEVDATMDAFDEVTQMLPGNLEEAVRTQHACVTMYEDWTRTYLEALQRWRAADVESARIRRQCVEDLRIGGPDRVALAASNAEKEASNHPTYTAHRDRCAALADEKDAAEASMKVAKARADAASDYVQALIQMGDAERERRAIAATRELRPPTPTQLVEEAGRSRRELWLTRDVLRDLCHVLQTTAQAASGWPEVAYVLKRALDVLGAARALDARVDVVPRRRKNAVDEEALNAEATGEPMTPERARHNRLGDEIRESLNAHDRESMAAPSAGYPSRS